MIERFVVLMYDRTSPFTSVSGQKMKFCIKDFFSMCEQILNFQRIWSHLLKKSLMENFIFCVVCKGMSANTLYQEAKGIRKYTSNIK